ncbi:hypothetical protein J4447_04875 [Candidatus Pacearchaeota archaeon]|nr:hypothetical protein [Candidatus Pacearchaeota archaeon]
MEKESNNLKRILEEYRKKKTWILSGIVILLIVTGIFYLSNQYSVFSLQKQYDNIPTMAGKAIFLKQSSQLTKSVDPELLDLDSQIITCQPDVDSLLSSNPSFGGSCVAGGAQLQSIDGLYLSGQCCGALMDTKERHESLEKLQAYKDIPDVPLDPFHTPIEIAKKWIDYDKNTILNSEEQRIYDEAMKMSKEGGPCCCKCWHWYVNEGIAKKMIKDYNYSAQQIANYWDVSDICG